jgi:chemotaxis protein methyltransferase CheR
VLADTVRDLTEQEYELIRRLVHDQSGINLGEQKQQLVRARLGKRLRSGRFPSFRAYYNHVKEDASGDELCALLDAISTNTTHLFRERQHFEFLAESLQDALRDRAWRAANNPLRVWSAGCSSGEEAHSIAMILDDVLREKGVTNLFAARDSRAGRAKGEKVPDACFGLDWKILATDISTRVLERARAGVYESHRLGTVPRSFRQRYFVCGGDDQLEVRISPALARRITFARFNLTTDHFPFRHGFHYIFCRNVMIYFDRPTQQRLVAKFAAQLRPGGYLLIGHSESLNGIAHGLRYVRPTIYQGPFS